MDTHLLLPSLHPATSLAPLDSNYINSPEHLTGLCTAFRIDSKSSFYLSAKHNKVVLN